MIAKALRWFGYGWVWLVGAYIMVSYALYVREAPSVWAGLRTVWADISNPWGLQRCIVVCILAAPGVLAFWLASRLAGKEHQPA